MRKTHSMFYAYLQCSVASVLPRGMGLSPGFYFIFYFFGSLEREPSLWENTWPWEILRTWENFPGIRLGNQDLWGGEKESTFDTGRRVETGTYHWEGRKPFVQTFEVCVAKSNGFITSSRYLQNHHIGHGQYLQYIAPSHQFLKSVWSFFRFWEYRFFEECIIVFQTPAQFPKNKDVSNTTSITLKFWL